eukprot:comp13688_c0_seq1/m.9343 comp13688_c0_seq1/g.9343  ORF comp13688_c0_seq1/g.9343 comp13688_c0_seq1/m.9343 type:complete len:359 (+) comp13688_c0_seq1:396-1472(+)
MTCSAALRLFSMNSFISVMNGSFLPKGTRFARFWIVLATRVSVRAVLSSGCDGTILNSFGLRIAGHMKRRKKTPLMTVYLLVVSVWKWVVALFCSCRNTSLSSSGQRSAANRIECHACSVKARSLLKLGLRSLGFCTRVGSISHEYLQLYISVITVVRVLCRKFIATSFIHWSRAFVARLFPRKRIVGFSVLSISSKHKSIRKSVPCPHVRYMLRRFFAVLSRSFGGITCSRHRRVSLSHTAWARSKYSWSGRIVSSVNETSARIEPMIFEDLGSSIFTQSSTFFCRASCAMDRLTRPISKSRMLPVKSFLHESTDRTRFPTSSGSSSNMKFSLQNGLDVLLFTCVRACMSESISTIQ